MLNAFLNVECIYLLFTREHFLSFYRKPFGANDNKINDDFIVRNVVVADFNACRKLSRGCKKCYKTLKNTLRAL